VQIDDVAEVRRACFLFTFEKNLMLTDGVAFCARSASNAVRIAITPALSSEAERAYKRHSELMSPLPGSVTTWPPLSCAALRHVG
jgi:hypothetical protein